MSLSGPEMYRKLDRPLSFIGEERSDQAYIDGNWVDLRELIGGSGGKPPVEKMRGRLDWIKSSLKEESYPLDRMEELYREGMGIKRALHLLGSRDRSSSSKTEDTKRWLDYGRRIR